MKKSVISLLTFMLVQSAFAFPVRSDVELLMNRMSSVKSQKSRGTCTIFSTIGLIEALFKIYREPWCSEKFSLPHHYRFQEFLLREKNSFSNGLKQGFSQHAMKAGYSL